MLGEAWKVENRGVYRTRPLLDASFSGVIPFSLILRSFCEAVRMILRVLVVLVHLIASTLVYAQAGATNVRKFPTVGELPVVDELPNPFVFLDGTPVRNRKDWERRREEMISIVLHYQFGHAPELPKPDSIKAEFLSEADELDGIATKRQAVLRFGPGQVLSTALEIHQPARSEGPFPVIVHNAPAGFEFEKAVIADLVGRGYMIVSYDRTDLHPDWGKDPVAKKKRDIGDARRAYPGHDWGCLRVWAWGGSVTLNWLSTLPRVDMGKIVCTGHSRGGQTAALMGMLDRRVSVVAPNAGGSITTGCHRAGDKSRFIKPKMAHLHSGYWYHPNLVPFGDNEHRLPFDLHFIKASVAPRAWFNSNGLSDPLNVKGSMITWRAAREVYDWLGVKERCAQWYRPGSHNHGVQDWKALADFADFILFKKPLPVSEDFYQEPWPEIPLHFSWRAP